mgnify:CR=1 FL=1
MLKMPKMYDKRTALQIIFYVGNQLEKAILKKGITECDVSKGELKRLFNKFGQRKKDVFSMALRKFAITEVIRTPYWEFRIVEPEKPRIHFKILRHDKETQ